MGKVITFFGADYKVGTTMITQCMGEYLTKIGERKMILIMHLDGKPGTEYSKGTNSSIANIRAALLADVLSQGEFLSNCSQNKNIYTLKGTNNLLERKIVYQPELVKKIIDLVKETFDYILIDAGASVDMGLSIGSLLFSDCNVLITTQQKTAFESFLQKEDQIFNNLKVNFSYLIINKFAYSTGAFLETESALAKKYGFENEETFVVPMEEESWQAEFEKVSLLSYRNKSFEKSIEQLIKILFNLTTEKKKKLSVFRRKS